MLAVQCAPEHIRQGVCLGAAWNLSYSSALTFPPNDIGDGSSGFDFVVAPDRSFSFVTQSQPPTFLLGVEPRSATANWKVSISSQSWGGYIDDVRGYNSKYKVITAGAATCE